MKLFLNTCVIGGAYYKKRKYNNVLNNQFR